MGQVQSAFDPDSQVPVVYDNPPFPSLYDPTFDSTVDGEGYFLHDANGELVFFRVFLSIAASSCLKEGTADGLRSISS